MKLFFVLCLQCALLLSAFSFSPPTIKAGIRSRQTFNHDRLGQSAAQRRTRDVASVTYASMSKISLDHSLLPGMSRYGAQPSVQPLVAMIVVAIVVVARALLRDSCLLSVFASQNTAGQVREFVGNAYEGVGHGMLTVLSVFSRLAERFATGASAVAGRVLRRSKRTSAFSITNWTACRLVHVEPVDANHNKYRFEFPGNLGDCVNVDVGQQIILCTVDAKGRTLKKSYFVSSPPSAQGCFEVLGRSGGHVSAAAGEDFALALQFAELGDEFAVKKGDRKLRLPDLQEPVSAIAVIATGMGILPALQLIRGALADPDSAVASLELLWVNDGKRDFVLNEEVEELQRRHGGALAVTRVIDREVGNANTLFNAELREALRPYQAGAVGLVLAEGVVADKCRALLSSRGFPGDHVVQLLPDSPMH